MLTTLKPYAEKSLQPIAHALRKVDPNLITLLGLVFPVLFFILLQEKQYGWALLAFLFNGVDMLDGLVARAQGKVTAFGGFLDSTVDRFADFVVLVAFGYAGLVSWNVVLPLVLLTYLISYIRSRTELAAKGTLVASVGLVERTERLAIVFAGLAVFALWPHVRWFDQNLLTVTFVLLAALSAVTVGQRILFAYRKL